MGKPATEGGTAAHTGNSVPSGVGAVRRASVVVAGVVTVAALLPAASAGAEEDYPRPAAGSFTVAGHGFGHGRGMSQYGARGAALAGLTSTQVLDFYYPGTAVASLATGNQIRVRLMAVPAAAVTVYGASGLRVRDVATGGVTNLTDTAALARYRVVADAAALRVQHSADGGSTWGAVTSGAGPMSFEGPPAVRVAYPDGTSRDYEGAVAGVRTGDTTVAGVNTLSMERYLNGVVPREMPASWPAVALQVQAVAARTYAAYGRAHIAAGAAWDTCDTTACQVYGGLRLYQGGTVTNLQPASSTGAVTATANRVRTYGGAPILAQFSSSNGGWTVADPNLPYLVAKADPYDAVDNPRANWTGTLPAATVQGCFPAVGTLDRIAVLSRDGHGSWGGRILDVRLDGHDGAGTPTAVTTTGTALRSCAPSVLFSTYFTITSGFTQTVTPGAVRDPGDGSMDLFTRGPVGDMYYRMFVSGRGWLPWQALGGSVVGAPAALRRADGSTQVWFRGLGNGLHSARVSAAGAFLGWQHWGGVVTSRPYPVRMSDGSTLVFYRGGDGALWYGSWNAAMTFTGWHGLGGGLTVDAGPGAAATGPGAVTVVVNGSSGSVYTRSLAGGRWGPWVNRGGAALGDVAAASPGAGTVDLYLRGTTSALYGMRAVNGQFGGWVNLGGVLGAGPFAAATPGRTDIYALGTNGSAYQRVRTSTWGPWVRLPN